MNVVPWVAIVLGLAFIAFMLGPHAWRYFRNQSILASGVEAPARVVEVIDTRVRVTFNPQVRVKLEVQPAEGEPFPAEVIVVLSAVDLQKVRPGNTVMVRYDPGDHSRVALAQD